MPTVVAAVVRGGRAFSCGAVALVVGDVGCGRDGSLWPFGCRAVMIMRARAPGHFGDVGPARQWRMRPPAVNACSARGSGSAVRGARLPWIYKSKEREGKSLTSSLSVCCPSPLASCSLRLCAPLCSRSLLASSTRGAANRNGSRSAHRGVGSPAVDSIDSDEVRLARAGERRATGAERGGSAPTWIVPPATDREPNPPFGYVVSFVRHHERGFTAPTSHFMHGLCHHYGVELHNFTPNAIS
jgi:hypothetical protein